MHKLAYRSLSKAKLVFAQRATALFVMPIIIYAGGAFGRKEGVVQFFPFNRMYTYASAHNLFALDYRLSCVGEDLIAPNSTAHANLPQECCDLCFHTPMCEAFTHRLGTCFFKSGCSQMRSCDGTCTAGRLRYGIKTQPKNLGDCDLCNTLQWIFIVSGGRTGSTTIMRMLNAAPGVHIDGENEGIHVELQSLWRHAKRSVVLYDNSAWAQKKLRRASLLCAMQRYVASAIGGVEGKTAVGYKEIRWDFSKHQLDFILELFPCAKFIFNDRMSIQNWKNSWTKTPGFNSVTANTLYQWKQQVRLWIKRHTATRTFYFPLEQFSNLSKWNKLLDFVGVHQCQYRRVFHFNNNGYAADSSNTSLLDCTFA